ncbi:MAG: HD domain-containing protein [Candidatus Shapirobacteria bacterium]
MAITWPAFVQKILQTFTQNHYQIYIVGGVVRDLLLKRPASDWDFTTNAKPEEILTLFPDAFYDNRFGTVGLANNDDPVYEITTFRRDFNYADHRRPEKVEWGKKLEDDLARRDFTINALALDPKGQLIDLFNGQEDLKNKLVRAVGNPDQRFQEDALRLMRAVRIATQLDFVIEKKTFASIQKNASLLDFVSAERIRDELLKLVASPGAAAGYRILQESRLTKKILPEVEAGFAIDQKSPNRHHIDDVGTHSLKSLEFSQSNDPIVKLATLIHDVGKVPTQKLIGETITFYNHEVVGGRMARKIACRLKLSRQDSEKLYRLVRWHLFTVDERQTDKAIRRFIRHVGPENLKDILHVRLADRLGSGAKITSWRLERFKQRLIEVQKQPFAITDLKINGHDVIKILKIQPGPLIGKILAAIFEEVENDPTLNTRDYLLKQIPLVASRLK